MNRFFNGMKLNQSLNFSKKYETKTQQYFTQFPNAFVYYSISNISTLEFGKVAPHHPL